MVKNSIKRLRAAWLPIVLLWSITLFNTLGLWLLCDSPYVIVGIVLGGTACFIPTAVFTYCVIAGEEIPNI